MDIALAIPRRGDRILVTRRAGDVHLAGYWEFPGGKVEPGEDPQQAARRELEEETGLVAERLEPLTLVVHDYREAPLRFHVYLASEPRGELRVDGDREWAWVTAEELADREMPEANRAMLRALRWRR